MTLKKLPTLAVWEFIAGVLLNPSKGLKGSPWDWRLLTGKLGKLHTPV